MPEKNKWMKGTVALYESGTAQGGMRIDIHGIDYEVFMKNPAILSTRKDDNFEKHEVIGNVERIWIEEKTGDLVAEILIDYRCLEFKFGITILTPESEKENIKRTGIISKCQLVTVYGG